MKCLITCSWWTAWSLTSELKHLKIKPFDTFDTGTFVDVDRVDIYRINLRSRVASKVYLHMWSAKVSSYDDLFALVSDCDRAGLLPVGSQVSINPVLRDATLYATKSVQSITHKALMDALPAASANPSLPIYDILVHIISDQASIYLNTSGRSLHHRGYRSQAWQAPLKEHIAAALILASGWRWGQRLVDPFCGSGTILIEAAMIARNIAPWRLRAFDRQTRKNADQALRHSICDEAQSAVFSKSFDMQWFDADREMIEMARANAQRAWVDDTITFITKPIQDLYIQSDQSTWIMTNPPYGKRIYAEDEALLALYDLMARPYIQGRRLSPDHRLTNHHLFTKKLIKNGPDEIVVWKKG